MASTTSIMASLGGVTQRGSRWWSGVDGRTQDGGAAWCHGGVDRSWTWQGLCVDLSWSWDDKRWWRRILQRVHAVHVEDMLVGALGSPWVAW